MADRLAKLDDLKALLGTTETALDALLGQMLDRATARAETLAGRPLARRAAIVEHPRDPAGPSRFARLARYPVESVASVVQLDAPGTDADFDAAVPLAEHLDYEIDAAMGKLERLGGVWTLRRCVRIV